ncbi:GDP-L-galactose phosphorylase 1 isoform X2 [Citrus clementina]|uniref:GDP-L-galactose phosphorylase 1 isoform X2 n=1 Tax=Citrus clementina TaxID=85681 RepID=UPI000CED5D9A|nr:GDP-L-galactose phosphorylase 1 isoform X2 [Citrus x clementina]
MVTIKQLEHTKSLTKSATPEQLKCSFLCFQGVPEDLSLLDALLLAQWEERMWRGCFRYDVTASEIKVISGGKKFLAQLNEKWIMDPFILNSIDQNEELLFCVTRSEKANSELIPSAAVPNDSILVIINANPIEYGHVFVVPCGSNRLYPDARSFEMIVRIAFEINNYSFRLFYDCSSPGASHVYFQACYFPDHLPVELMPIDTFFSDGQRGIYISTLIDYPIKTILFEYTHNNRIIMMEAISEICSSLREKNISYNLLISDCGKRIFLFLQKSAISGNLLAWECGGYFLFGSKYEFDQVTEEAIHKRLSAVSLNDEGFQVVKQLCCSIASKLAV